MDENVRFQVVLASYDHTDVTPFYSISLPIVDGVNGDETEMAYVVTDILSQEFQNIWHSTASMTILSSLKHQIQKD